MGGLSYAEIADVTASTVPAVRSRIYRARQTLRARLLPPSREAAFSVRGTDDD
jgi:DNA-directed RNA polymerase specialized sigma24 family protein